MIHYTICQVISFSVWSSFIIGINVWLSLIEKYVIWFCGHSISKLFSGLVTVLDWAIRYLVASLSISEVSLKHPLMILEAYFLEASLKYPLNISEVSMKQLWRDACLKHLCISFIPTEYKESKLSVLIEQWILTL